mmetsp:Transcript_24439/g.56800  ORF Transcript_24439/g.56800 Transcript_24439/m.56800 type:complete len:287 (-) Transcript_24439:144-1004(-)
MAASLLRQGMQRALPRFGRVDRFAGGLTAARSLVTSRFLRAEVEAPEAVDELFTNNERWRSEVQSKDPEFFSNLAWGQKPRYLWIGCSDSRVPPESICGLPPGSLFVHRNIANLVNNVDASVMSVIQFAVMHLKVQHIVICGHYNCGGVAAAMTQEDHKSPLENWLRNIRDTYRLHAHELDSIEDVEDRRKRLVEINVIEQAINLFKAQVIQQRRVETKLAIDEFGFVQPRIHPCVYNPGTGELRKLDVEMSEVLESLKHIYNLYKVDTDEDGEAWEGMGPSMVTP